MGELTRVVHGGRTVGARRRRQAAVGLFAIALVVAGCGTSEDDSAEAESDATSDDTEMAEDASSGEGSELTLRYTSILAPGTSMALSSEAWAEDIVERTGGRVEVDTYYAASLLGASDTIPGLTDGRVDVGYSGPFYAPQGFPLWGGAELPMIQGDNPVAQVQALTQLYEEHDEFRAEFEDAGLRVMHFIPISSAVIGIDGEFSSLDQLEGKRIRSGGGITDALDAIGAEPVAIAGEELYESLQRDVIDGYSAAPFDAVISMGLHELRDNIWHAGLGLFGAPANVMSEEVWQSLDGEVQDHIEEANEAYLETSIEILVEAEDEACTRALDDGVSVTVLPNEAQERWRETAEDAIIDAWVGRAGEAGVNENTARSFLDRYLELVEEFSQSSDHIDGMQRCSGRS